MLWTTKWMWRCAAFARMVRSCYPETDWKHKQYIEIKRFSDYLEKNVNVKLLFEQRKRIADNINDPEHLFHKQSWIERLGSTIYKNVTRHWDRGSKEPLTFDEASQICEEQYNFHLRSYVQSQE